MIKLYNNDYDIDLESSFEDENIQRFESDDILDTLLGDNSFILVRTSDNEIYYGFGSGALVEFKVKVLSIETNGIQDYP